MIAEGNYTVDLGTGTPAQIVWYIGTAGQKRHCGQLLAQHRDKDGNSF